MIVPLAVFSRLLFDSGSESTSLNPESEEDSDCTREDVGVLRLTSAGELEERDDVEGSRVLECWSNRLSGFKLDDDGLGLELDEDGFDLSTEDETGLLEEAREGVTEGFDETFVAGSWVEAPSRGLGTGRLTVTLETMAPVEVDLSLLSWLLPKKDIILGISSTGQATRVRRGGYR